MAVPTSGPLRISRRPLLAGAAALGSLTLLERRSAAGEGANDGANRTEPFGGRLTFRLPWPVRAIDPHRLDDAAAAFLGAALFDSLYSVDASGSPVPALAEALPEPGSSGSPITLREGLRFASGREVAAADIVASLERARSLGARAWLEPLGQVRATGPRTVTVDLREGERAARVLASPFAAIVSRRSTVDHPDGTGPFAARYDGDVLVLARSPFATSGPPLLEEIRVAPAPDLAESLRAFESGQDDLGWLGLGLHEPRRGAVAFDVGSVGWALLSTGSEAAGWNLPGTAQRLADGVDPARLAHLGVRADWQVEPDEGWGGPPAALLVRADSPWLVELARALAAALSRPGHEVTLSPRPPAELRAARETNAYALALEFARPFDASPFGTMLTLAAAESGARATELARHPPRGHGVASPRVIARLLRVGVVANVRAHGGARAGLAVPASANGAGFDFRGIGSPAPSVP